MKRTCARGLGTVALFLLGLSGIVAQPPPAKKDPTALPKNHAIVTGASIHTYGVGLDLQYRRKYRDRIDWLFSFNAASFKDPSEARIISANFQLGGRDFVYDKRNHTYFLALTAGAQYTLIERNEFSRVQVSAGLGAGPTLALLKPYLLEVIRDVGGGFAELVVEPYSGPFVHPYGLIFGQADYLQRFDLITSQWGFRVRGDATVDFSGSSYFIRAIHMGAQFDLFGSPVPILYVGPNRNYFFGVFAGFVIGNAWE